MFKMTIIIAKGGDEAEGHDMIATILRALKGEPVEIITGAWIEGEEEIRKRRKRASSNSNGITKGSTRWVILKFLTRGPGEEYGWVSLGDEELNTMMKRQGLNPNSASPQFTHLIRLGYIKRSSERGLYGITEEGRKAIAKVEE
jgi:hypothetical protein